MLNIILCIPYFMVFLSAFMLKEGSMETSKPWIYMSFGLCLISTIVNYRTNKISLKIGLSDVFLLLFYFIVLVISCIAPFTNLAKLEIFTLLILLYFCCRISFIQNVAFKYWITFFYVLSVLTFSLYGLLQYVNVLSVLSPEGYVSGSFSNHGIYAGFIATAIPLLFYIIVRIRYLFKRLNSSFSSLFKYRLLWIVSVLSFLVIIVDLSVLKNRATILALIISIPVVLIGFFKSKLIRFIKNNRIVTSILCLLLLLTVYGLAKQLYNQSLYSSEVRYKTALIAISTIKENKWGAGIGSFASGYKPQQIKYNRSTIGNERLNFVAPYPYNEYLQIGVEYGILGLLCYVLLIASVVYKGFLLKNYGYVASLICLQIFSIMWYPYLFMSFLITLVFLLSVSVSETNYVEKRNMYTPFILVIMSVLCTVCISRGWYRERVYKQFENMVADPENFSVRDYNSTYSLLNDNEEFLTQYYLQLKQLDSINSSKLILDRLNYFSSKREIYLGLSRHFLICRDTVQAENEMMNYFYLNTNEINAYYVLSDFYLTINDLINAQIFIDKIQRIDTISFSFKNLQDRKKRLEKNL